MKTNPIESFRSGSNPTLHMQNQPSGCVPSNICFYNSFIRVDSFISTLVFFFVIACFYYFFFFGSFFCFFTLKNATTVNIQTDFFSLWKAEDSVFVFSRLFLAHEGSKPAASGRRGDERRGGGVSSRRRQRRRLLPVFFFFFFFLFTVLDTTRRSETTGRSERVKGHSVKTAKDFTPNNILSRLSPPPAAVAAPPPAARHHIASQVFHSRSNRFHS